MKSNTILQQLMSLRMNSIMNEITNSDMKYQDILRQSDDSPDKLDTLNLPTENRIVNPLAESWKNSTNSSIDSPVTVLLPAAGIILNIVWE